MAMHSSQRLLPILIAGLVGAVLGAASIAVLLVRFNADFGADYSDNIRRYWNRTGKTPAQQEELLRACGRSILENSAFAIAKVGSTQEYLRDVFGPPDVALSDGDLERWQLGQPTAVASVDLYKMGRCGFVTDHIYFQVFELAFDANKKLITAASRGLSEGHPWANYDVSGDEASSRNN